MATSEEIVICPHCGAENAKSPIVTTCCKCLLPLDPTAVSETTVPLPPQAVAPEYSPSAVPPLPRADVPSRSFALAVVGVAVLGLLMGGIFTFTRGLTSRAAPPPHIATPPPTARLPERPEKMPMRPSTPPPAVPAQVSYPPLQAATVAGNAAEVKRLLESGTPVDQKDSGGHTALQRACENGTADPGALTLLLTYGANPEARCPGSQLTPLHWAASRGYTACLVVLLKYKPDVNARDAKGHSPLGEAASSGNPDVAKILLDHGADVAAADNDGRAPLHTAAENGRIEFARALLARGADVNMRDKWGRTPLYWAATRDAPDMARFLVERGAKVKTVDKDGRTPLHVAAYGRHTEVARYLLDHGADPNAKSNTGWTPLHDTTCNNAPAAAALLLQRGANRDAKTNDGKTALQIATEKGQADLIKALQPSPTA